MNDLDALVARIYLGITSILPRNYLGTTENLSDVWG